MEMTSWIEEENKDLIDFVIAEDWKSFQSYGKGDITTKELLVEVSTVKTIEILDPQDASNDRGNPEVLVGTYFVDVSVDKYIFEFVHPSHSGRRDPIYKSGIYHSMEKQPLLPEMLNDARLEAAKSLANRTDTPVESKVWPESNLVGQKVDAAVESDRLVDDIEKKQDLLEKKGEISKIQSVVIATLLILVDDEVLREILE